MCDVHSSLKPMNPIFISWSILCTSPGAPEASIHGLSFMSPGPSCETMRLVSTNGRKRRYEFVSATMEYSWRWLYLCAR